MQSYLKEELKRRGISSRFFAEKIGVSEVMVSRYNNGICFPSIPVFYQMSKVLNIPMNELFERWFGNG